MGTSPGDSSTVRRLRVFKVVTTTLNYCVRNAGRLLAVAWFPCLLASACKIALEWLIFGWPPRMPEWLVSNYYFDPPTWLAAFVSTPWEAMAWVFVLSYMADTGSTRGAVAIRRLDWLRFAQHSHLSRRSHFLACKSRRQSGAMGRIAIAGRGSAIL